MSKKSKMRRKEAYKKFMDSMAVYREKFVNKKIQLIEKILSNDELKNKIMQKNRTEMNKLERACVDTIVSREIQNLEQFNQIKDKIKDLQIKKAKFKYKPKAI